MTSVRPKLKPDVPKVVTSWNVETGRTVYRKADGTWSSDLRDAIVLTGDTAEAELSKAAAEQSLVVDPYFMEVTEAGEPTGRETLRETIRVHGPTIRPDLGRQAANN